MCYLGDDHASTLISKVLHSCFHINLLYSFTDTVQRHVKQDEGACPAQTV